MLATSNVPPAHCAYLQIAIDCATTYAAVFAGAT